MQALSKTLYFLSCIKNTGKDDKTGREFAWQTIELLEEGSPTIRLTADSNLDFGKLSPMDKIKVVVQISQYSGKVKCKVVSYNAVQ